MRNNFALLLKAKAQREKRKRVPMTEVADATGLSRQTLARFAREQLREYPEDMLVQLCAYFECGIGDLLSIEEVPDG
jgi:DNA-binding Xre family transcriptional regulator